MNGAARESQQIRPPLYPADHVLAWSLRICGVIDLLALLACFMPVEWMRHLHRLCRLGEFPEQPIAEYLARSTSLLWGLHGLLLIYLSRDVVQHASLIRFVAWMTIVAGGLAVLSGLRAGLPGWWIAIEGPVFSATGLWYLWWIVPHDRDACPRGCSTPAGSGGH
jgi:hypothetical protein